MNVRIIAGSKRDLRQMVAEGKFREDLYYRLNVLPVALPPLRERREDIPRLMEHFLARYFGRRGEDRPAISDAVKQAFARYSWPGNCASSRTRASGSRRPARAGPCASAACRPAFCSVRPPSRPTPARPTAHAGSCCPFRSTTACASSKRA